MIRTILFVILSFVSSTTFANEAECIKLAAKGDASEYVYRPAMEAKVIGKGRLNFYSAPSERCPIKGVFVISGNFLTVYTSFEGWAQVMYVAKGGGDFSGWVPENRLEEVGQYGKKP